MAERSFNWLILAPAVLFAVLATGFYAGMQRENPNELPSALENQNAPSLDLPPLYDTAQPPLDEELRSDGVKLVNFWASWCGPCRAEHPTLTALSEGGLPVFGINYKDKNTDAQAFLEELGDPFTRIGVDATGRTAIDWGVYGVPETFVIDGEGRILARYPGPLTARVWEERLKPVVEAAGD